jgi:FkbH-like protein
VQSRFPDVEGILFEGKNPAAARAVVARLWTLFGKDAVRDEDRLRAASLRSAATMRAAAAEQGDGEAFLSQLGARLVLDLSRDRSDARAFELVNKTNQFNLNGRRYTAAEWAAALDRPDAFLLTVGYEDRYGPLGKVGVALGTASDGEVRIDAWVLSCRAFSRRVEDATLRALFGAFGADALALDFAPTPRNGPTQELVARYAALGPGGARVTRAAFDAAAPALHHEVVLRVAEPVAAVSGGLSTAASADRA